MIGSRAVGTARPGSDLDLVVLLEIPLLAPPWGEAEVAAERSRLYKALGEAPLRLDIGVRTTDQFAEAHPVVGGPEHLIVVQGVTLFTRALDRAPVVRRTPDQVRFDNAGTWIKHALLAAERAVACENARALGSDRPEARWDSRSLARSAMERSITAVLVLHGVHTEKRIGIDGMLAALRQVEPITARVVQDLAGAGHPTAHVAFAVVSTLLRRLAGDRGMTASLASVLAKRASPVVLLGG